MCSLLRQKNKENKNINKFKTEKRRRVHLHTNPAPKMTENTKEPTLFSGKQFQMKPTLDNSFKTSEIKDIVQNILSQTLTGKQYEPKLAEEWTRSISNTVGLRVKELSMNRYKHVVQVVLGQQTGAGAKYIARCRWDSETDNQTSATFNSQSLFCIVTVFGIYLY